MTEVRWSNDLTIQFVEQYRSQPCLWDIEHLEYKNKQARDAALQDIVDNLDVEGFTVAGARKKLRVIRSAYWNEHSKILKSKMSGTETVYKPNVSWFVVADQFLRKVTNWREIESNLEVQMHATDDDCTGSEYQNQSPERFSSGAPAASQYGTSQSSAKRRRRIELEQEASEGASIRSRNLKDGDEYDAIGVNVAAKLRKLPPQMKIIAEKLINDVLYEAQLQNLTKRSTINVGDQSLDTSFVRAD